MHLTNAKMSSPPEFTQTLHELYTASGQGRSTLHGTVRASLKHRYALERLTTLSEPHRDATYMFCVKEVVYTPKKDLFADDPHLATPSYLLLVTV